MALATLSAIKTHLGISGSTEDTALSALIRQVTEAIRSYTHRNLGDAISSITAAASAVVTSLGHGLETGDTIVVYGSDCTPTIDGSRVVTRLTDDTFSVPITTSVAGTAGFFARQFVEFHRGGGTSRLYLRETPVQSISSIYLDNAAYWGSADGAFAASTLLTDGTDYALVLDDSRGQESRSGLIERINDAWPSIVVRPSGLLAGMPQPGLGNIKVTYVGGYRRLPGDIELAIARYVATIRNEAKAGGPLESESLDYYSYTRVSPDMQAKAMGSIQQLLGRYKTWVW